VFVRVDFSVSRSGRLAPRANDEIKVVGELLAIRNERKPLWSGVHAPLFKSRRRSLAMTHARVVV
jgi:hypothetical protein